MIRPLTPSNRYLTTLIVWILLLVIAYGVAKTTNLTLLTSASIVTMLLAAGILLQTLLPSPDNDASDSTSQGDTDASNRLARAEKPRKATVTATAGLNATERNVQNRLIQEAYREFFEYPIGFTVSSHRSILLTRVSEELDVERDIVEKVFHISKDDGFFKRQSGGRSLFLTPKAVHRAAELNEDILLDEHLQEEIMDILIQTYREEPRRPRATREELVNAVAHGGLDVDHNIWLLREKRYVKLHNGVGTDAGYRSVELTQRGRQIAR